jgi:hypothetical protein
VPEAPVAVGRRGQPERLAGAHDLRAGHRRVEREARVRVRHARREAVAVEELEDARLGGAPHHVHRVGAERGARLAHDEAAHLPEVHRARDGRGQARQARHALDALLGARAGLLLGAHVERVVERQAGAPAQLLGEGEVLRGEAPPRPAGGEAERAEHASARHERHVDEGAEADAAQLREVRLVVGDGAQHLVGQLLDELRLAGGDHLGHAGRGVGAHRVALVDLAREPLHRRVGVMDGDGAHAVAVEHVVRRPVGEPRHREAHEARERRVVVERLAEQRGGLAEEALPRLGAAPLGHVGEHHHGGRAAVVLQVAHAELHVDALARLGAVAHRAVEPPGGTVGLEVARQVGARGGGRAGRRP